VNTVFVAPHDLTLVIARQLRQGRPVAVQYAVLRMLAERHGGVAHSLEWLREMVDEYQTPALVATKSESDGLVRHWWLWPSSWNSTARDRFNERHREEGDFDMEWLTA
jgi:hypothetical protein